MPHQDLTAEVLDGLTQDQPRLSPKFFYDSAGSVLFESITQLPEYYPTRVEAEVFTAFMDEMAVAMGEGDVLIEPGSGNCAKARPLLEAARPAAFVPIDIAGDFLFTSAASVAEDFPDVAVIALAADFTGDWPFSEEIPEGRRVVFYPGSTLGNLEPHEAVAFLRQLGEIVDGNGGVLLGLDLHKDAATLEAAYDDSQGVTAEFNRNSLKVVNDATGANFAPEHWKHEAVYNVSEQRIEMYLVSTDEQRVRIGDTELQFGHGDRIHTESSYKYTRAGLEKLAAEAGFSVSHFWTDPGARFSVSYLSPQD